MDTGPFFYEQTRIRGFQKRFKKMPEDLPDSLKFAHLNPKVAAYLASKEKQKNEEMFGDGLSKSSLMPEISQAFNAVKNCMDSSLANDEDSQRFLFDEARSTSGTVLLQLSRIIYFFENIANHIPKSLECQMMSSFIELVADVQIVPREWQTATMKEQYLRRLTEAHSDDEDKVNLSQLEDTRSSSRGPGSTVTGASDPGTGRHQKGKRLLSKGAAGLPEIIEDSEGLSDSRQIKRNDSRLSAASRRSKDRKGLDMKASAALANPSYYMSVIQFQLSSKACEEKGWIVQKGREEELAREAILEWCMQLLIQSLKDIKEQRSLEGEMGYLTPVTVQYYISDSRRESLLKYRRSPTRLTRETTSLPNPSLADLKSLKPRIPPLYDDSNEGKQLLKTSHNDGTTIVYYPSGRPAVVASAAGFGRPGFYTIVYEDDPDLKMLATFTPSGRGVCYHHNGNIRFLATVKGGHIANREGRILRHWKWPQAQVKLTSPVSFQMNHHLGFRCVSETYIIILFTSNKESTRFFVSGTPGAVEIKPDDTDQLLTTFTFSSKAAKDLLRLFAPKVKSKKSRKKEAKMTKQVQELVRSMESNEKLIYDLDAEKDLLRLQRKSRNLVDDWMEHYRVTIGLKSPTLAHLELTPHKSRHGAASAKMNAGYEERRYMMGVSMANSLASSRVPSAPSRATNAKHRSSSAGSDNASPNRFSSTPTVKFDQRVEDKDYDPELDPDGEDRPFTSTFSDKLSRFSESSIRSKSATSSPGKMSRQVTTISMPEREPMPGNLNNCPNALRMQMQFDSRPQCRCTRHSISFITDVEYDKYIKEAAPRIQLQIIIVVSSCFPQTNHAEMMLNQIHQNQNRNRTRPCLQCRQDMFRILKYDINTATEDSNHTQPLLLTRHNVVPGMFLIYADGRLLFCDHIFNGYGNTSKDFKKQVMKSKMEFLHGFSLPKDFKFSPSHGNQGARAPWGGEIGGAGVDNFGSPGTALARTLTDLGSQLGSQERLTDTQVDSLRGAWEMIAQMYIVQQHDQRSSRVPELPPIIVSNSKKTGHGKSPQYDSVRNTLPGPTTHRHARGRPTARAGRMGRAKTLHTFSLGNNQLTLA